MQNNIVQPCWECFDFEAAATHEIGHLLGLGHPDLAGLEVRSGFGGGSSAAGSAAGSGASNVYTAFFATPSAGAASRYPNASTSLTLWDTVTAGLPPDATINRATGQRQSIMDSFTAHNPHVCLSADDVEGLNTLYPVSSGAVVDPLCLKSPLYIGFIRMVVYVAAPFTLALLLSILVHACSHTADEERIKATQKELVQAKVAMRLMRTSQMGQSAQRLALTSGTAREGARGGAGEPGSESGVDPGQASASPSTGLVGAVGRLSASNAQRAAASSQPARPAATRTKRGGVEMYETVM